jgi:hypothetical protein
MMIIGGGGARGHFFIMMTPTVRAGTTTLCRFAFFVADPRTLRPYRTRAHVGDMRRRSLAADRTPAVAASTIGLSSFQHCQNRGTSRCTSAIRTNEPLASDGRLDLLRILSPPLRDVIDIGIALNLRAGFGVFPFWSDLVEIEVDRRPCKTDGRRLLKRSPNRL